MWEKIDGAEKMPPVHPGEISERRVPHSHGNLTVSPREVDWR